MCGRLVCVSVGFMFIPRPSGTWARGHMGHMATWRRPRSSRSELEVGATCVAWVPEKQTWNPAATMHKDRAVASARFFSSSK